MITVDMFRVLMDLIGLIVLIVSTQLDGYGRKNSGVIVAAVGVGIFLTTLVVVRNAEFNWSVESLAHLWIAGFFFLFGLLQSLEASRTVFAVVLGAVFFGTAFGLLVYLIPRIIR